MHYLQSVFPAVQILHQTGYVITHLDLPECKFACLSLEAFLYTLEMLAFLTCIYC